MTIGKQTENVKMIMPESKKESMNQIINWTTDVSLPMLSRMVTGSQQLASGYNQEQGTFQNGCCVEWFSLSTSQEQKHN